MEKELVDLSNTLLEIYQKNLIFLEENFNDLYKRINKLSNKIDKEEYSSKYSLEYNNGYFDILNLENNTWFYGTNSYEDADIRAVNSNFTKDGSLDLLRKGKGGIKLVKSESYSDVMPIIEYINENVDLENIEFHKIYKMVFIGSGLGVHINEIFKKLDPFVTLIIEPELEIFRLSLFITDYSIFNAGNKTLQFSIEEDSTGRMASFSRFYSMHNYMNYNIKHHMLIKNYQYINDELIEYFSNNSTIYFPYTNVIRNLHRTVGFIKDKSRFLDVDLLTEKLFLKDKEVLMISAGPSLDNYIEFIKEHQDSFIIVCVDVIVKKLEKNNIVPDIVVSIDQSPLCAGYLDTEDNNYLNNSAIVFLSQQDESVLNVVKGKNYYFSQSIPLIKEIGFLGSANNVGSFSLKMAIHFGANKIYTIGNDAAFHQETGSRYAKDSSYTIIESADIKELSENFISSDDNIEVEGNLRKIVKTNRALLTFKESFENTYSGLKDVYDFDIYNLSDGVKIDGFKPMKEDELKAIIKQNIKFDICNKFDSVSKILEFEDYEDDIKILNNLINKVKKYKKNNIITKDEFLENKLDLMMYILNKTKLMKSGVYGNIFLLYTELVDIYVNFILNIKQKDLHTKQSLKKISNLWADGVINVLKDLKKAVK
jgi:hypothetical protein